MSKDKISSYLLSDLNVPSVPCDLCGSRANAALIFAPVPQVDQLYDKSFLERR
ncbi:3098_t:CDS:1, partial [Dentiscutata erythropus]